MKIEVESLFMTGLTAQNLENLIRKVIREELETFFENQKLNQPAQVDEDKILSVKEAAEYLNMSPSNIYRLCDINYIPYFKKSGKLLFSKKELTSWLMEGRNRTTKEIAAFVDTNLSKNLKNDSK